MSEGIFGKDADLAQRLKGRIAFHANEHRHTYEIGKGVMDALVLDLLADFRDAGGVILPVKPNGTVWLTGAAASCLRRSCSSEQERTA